MSDKIDITPAGVPQTSFTGKVEEYEKALASVTDIETKIEGVELSIRELLHKNEVKDIGYHTTDLIGLEEKLTIHKPVVEEEHDGLTYVCAKTEGRSFSEIVSNPSLMRRLEKKLGKEFSKFFREVDDIFHRKDITVTPEVDEEKTTALKSEYNKLVSELVKLKVQLKTASSNVDNIEKYISFVKELGTLVGKPAGKDQQQGGQKPQN